jgi:hypothetical protein
MAATSWALKEGFAGHLNTELLGHSGLQDSNWHIFEKSHQIGRKTGSRPEQTVRVIVGELRLMRRRAGAWESRGSSSRLARNGNAGRATAAAILVPGHELGQGSQRLECLGQALTQGPSARLVAPARSAAPTHRRLLPPKGPPPGRSL